MENTMRFKEYLKEAGFAKFPPGWTRKSVIKFAKTLTAETGKGPKEKGFFDACVDCCDLTGTQGVLIKCFIPLIR